MTTFEHATETSHAATRTAVASRAVNAVIDFIRAWRNRRAFYRLGEMSDTELADIGLTRSDLSVAIHLGSDPTSHLGAMARRRSAEELARLAG